MIVSEGAVVSAHDGNNNHVSNFVATEATVVDGQLEIRTSANAYIDLSAASGSGSVYLHVRDNSTLIGGPTDDYFTFWG